MVGGGALGAVFGVSFGPVGIVLAAVVGTGVGHLLAKFLFDRDHASESWEFDNWATAPLTSTPADGSVNSLPAAPGLGLSAEAARLNLDQTYREYRRLLSQASPSNQAVEVGRQAYQKALGAYREAFSGR
jgi:hypothetical protein